MRRRVSAEGYVVVVVHPEELATVMVTVAPGLAGVPPDGVWATTMPF
jgi:hypothetical protein